jgi:hypothetical protein
MRLVALVPSRTVEGRSYRVSEADGRLSCECRGFAFRGGCAHVQAARCVLVGRSVPSRGPSFCPFHKTWHPTGATAEPDEGEREGS